MQRHARLGLLLGSILALGGLACQQAPQVAFEVSPVEGDTGRLQITLEVEGSPQGDLRLKGFAAKEVLRISDVEATGGDGAPLEVRSAFETITSGSSLVDVPTFTVASPHPAPVRIRYRVQPGNREGDSHVGYTGRCYGYAGPEFVFVTGRNLFLLPDGAESISKLTVRFTTPEGWGVAAPWRREGDRWLPGLDGTSAAEHLVTAAVGLGKFRERSVEVEGTRYRLAFEAGIPAAEEERTAALIEKTARYFRGLFARDLGPEYLTIVAPRAPTGDDIAGEGWATGQGASIAPMTANRLHAFAERLIEAYTRHAPYRTEVSGSGEFWLVDAVKGWYSWRAVAHAGLMSHGEVTRNLASDYISTLNVHGMERDLEKLYAVSGSQRITRDVLAPFTLLLIDHEVRAATKDKVKFDSLLGRLFRERKAESLWSVLPAVRPGFWEEFRSLYVKGKEVAPVKQFYSLAPVKQEPEPAAGKPVRKIALLYTGETTGYLENCGCKTNQSGGVARRATVLQRARERHPDALVLDAGEAFLRPKTQAELDFLTKQEQSLYLRTVDFMKYQGIAVASTELMFGLEHFREHTRRMATPYLSANIRSNGKLIAPPSLVRRTGGLRAAVIAVFEPPSGREANTLFEENMIGLEVEDPVETLRREVPVLGRQAEVVIAIGRLTPFTIRRIIEACPDLDVIISSEFKAPTQEPGDPGTHMHQEDQEGFLGRTLVLYTHLTNYGLGSAELAVDAEGRIAGAKFDDVWLDEKIPDHPAVRTLLNDFYDRVGKIAAAQESVPPLFADDLLRVSGRYVGGSVCAGCHEAEHQQWMTTSHASAFKTLLDRHRHFQPKCVSCHVVGYGTPHGYRLGAAEQTLANVQCEVCHGPGAGHAEAPSLSNIQKVVPEKICLECHNPEHSDHFVYAERLPKVRHDYYEEGMAPPTQAH